MDDFDQFERSLAAALRSDADMSVARFEPATIASAAVASTRRRSLRIAQGFSVKPASNRWPIAAAVVIGALIVGALLPAMVGRPSPTPSAAANPSLPGIVAPSSTPSATAPNASAFAPSTGVWIATGTMGTPRFGHTAVRLLDGRVLVAGGADGPGEFDLTSAELYDPNSGTWSATGNMAKPLRGFPATLLSDGKVLVGDIDLAGVGDPSRGNTGAEVYDPASGTWTSTGEMVTDVGGVATLLRNGKVLVTGPEVSQLYDPDSGTWTATGKMITPRYNHAAVLLPDGRVLVAGGDVADHPVDSAELYDPDTGTWTAIAPMHGAKDSITATLLPDGKVLAVGEGFLRPPTPPELYDPATGTWTVIGDPARPGTSYRSALLLSDGMVLLTDAPDAVLYDPGTGSWTATGTMLAQHNGAPSAALLLDGTVLVTGGMDCPPAGGECTGTSSAELYVPAGLSPPSAVLALPSPAPTPSPTPSPTPVPPEIGPVPPGARPWKLTVSNKSSDPATLFVAEENEQGLLGRLVGSATPNVVPPGATVEVTFLLPAKETGWAIFVNPGPNEGPVAGPAEMSLPGQIHINLYGQTGWLSP